MVRNPNDILLFISIIASSVYVFKHYYHDNVSEFKKLNFTMDDVYDIEKTLKIDYKKQYPSIFEDTSTVDITGFGSKISKTLIF